MALTGIELDVQVYKKYDMLYFTKQHVNGKYTHTKKIYMDRNELQKDLREPLCFFFLFFVSQHDDKKIIMLVICLKM